MDDQFSSDETMPDLNKYVSIPSTANKEAYREEFRRIYERRDFTNAGLNRPGTFQEEREKYVEARLTGGKYVCPITGLTIYDYQNMAQTWEISALVHMTTLSLPKLLALNGKK